MKKTLGFSAVAFLCGIAAFALRMNHLHNGFEAATGLPVPSHPSALSTAAFLLVSALLLLVLSARLPQTAAAFPFCGKQSWPLTITITGTFLMMLSGGTQIFSALGILPAAVSGSPNLSLILGLLTVASGACPFLAVIACRRGGFPGENLSPGTLLLIPPVALIVRLILTYRSISVIPSLLSYYVELLALTAFILGFYQLSSFAFSVIRQRRFAWFVGMSVVLGAAALADNISSYTQLLFYLGTSLTLFGLFLLQSDISSNNETP